MRYLVPLIALTLIGCGSNQANITRVGEKTFVIESPPVPGGGTGPNRRAAEQACNNRGYRVLDQDSHKGGPDRADWYEHNTTTVWKVECI
ncbi:MAG TPA: hypothetical protein VM782_02895 [Stellaceae bacterium]|nr:hypothetical protein [Stellaceae bacterium]